MLKCIQVNQPAKVGRQHEFTGYDGSKNWAVVHDEMEKIECDFCKDKGIKLMRGVHDSVNIHLDKPALYPGDLNFLLNHVAWAARQISPSGLRCDNC